MQKQIVHFSHKEHSLIPCDLDQFWRGCVMCSGKISPKLSYGCSKCPDFFIHESCAQQRQQMIHPLHPHHRLRLSTMPGTDEERTGRYFICCACGVSNDFFDGGFVFLCLQCRFQLHFHCGFLVRASSNNYDYEESQQQQRLGQTHDRFILCKKGSDLADKISCSACGEPFDKEESIHVCLERKLALHKSCVDLPLQIQHHFHPQHPLTLLTTRETSGHCNACRDFIWRRMVYYCSQCNFLLHITCASLMPANVSYAQEHRIEYINQTHPLILCNKKEKNFNFSCSGCDLTIVEDSLFVCLECKFLLHKSCTQLPQKIIHALHPKHPLILTPPVLTNDWLCNACDDLFSSLAYQCYECDYTIDHKCASSTYIVPTKYKFHQHPLVFFNETTSIHSCSVCDLKFYTPYVRCTECEFRIHVHCIPNLPTTIKPNCHRHPLTFSKSSIKDRYDEDEDIRDRYDEDEDRHPLTFTKSPIRDRYDEDEDEDEDRHPLTFTKSPIKDRYDGDEDGDGDGDADGDWDLLMYYCDACEERRRPVDASYCCTECRYVAHVHCVISQVLPFLKEDSHLACKLGDTKLGTPNAIEENTNASMEQEGEAMLEAVLGADDAKVTPPPMEESTSVPQLIISKNGGNEVPANPTIAILDEEILELNLQVQSLKNRTRELEQRRANLVSSTHTLESYDMNST